MNSLCQSSSFDEFRKLVIFYRAVLSCCISSYYQNFFLYFILFQEFILFQNIIVSNFIFSPENSPDSLSSSDTRDESFKYNKHAEAGYSRMESYFNQNQLTDITLISGTIFLFFLKKAAHFYNFYYFLNGPTVSYSSILCLIIFNLKLAEYGKEI